MLVATFLKQPTKLDDFSRLAMAWLIFLCLTICSVPVFAQQKSLSTELVFCPLQKVWVKGNQSGSELRSIDDSLDEICAPSESKQHFVFELAKSLFSKRIEAAQITREQLFFRYLEKGRQAFAEINPSGNLPDRQLTKAAAKETISTTNYQVDFNQKSAAVFALETLARPPTFHHDTNFDFQFAHELKKISRNINPRSPPFSI